MHIVMTHGHMVIYSSTLDHYRYPQKIFLNLDEILLSFQLTRISLSIDRKEGVTILTVIVIMLHVY